MGHMTTTSTQQVPPWTLGWRLRRALAYADMTTDQMAVELDRSRGTISHWLNDVSKPPRLYLREFASVTGVPLEWLEDDATSHSIGTSPVVCYYPIVQYELAG